jgi:hypothetical protein
MGRADTSMHADIGSYYGNPGPLDSALNLHGVTSGTGTLRTQSTVKPLILKY